MAVGAEEKMQPVKVLNTWRSPFGMRALIALKEKRVQYEYQEEDLPFHKSQLLLDSNPVYKKIPVLIHNGKPVCESLIIVQYIDEAWPSPQEHLGFLPKDPFERASARFWADYVDKKVTEAAYLIIKNVDGSQLMEQGKEDLKRSLKALDGALRDGCGGAGPFFGGQQIGLVDITLAPFTCWFEVFGSLGNFKVLDEGECPHLFAWAKAVVEVPSVKEAISISPSQKLLESIRMLRKTLFGLKE